MGKTNLCKHQFVPLPWLCRRKKTWGKGWFQTQGRLDLGIPALKSITFSLKAFLPGLHGNEQKPRGLSQRKSSPLLQLRAADNSNPPLPLPGSSGTPIPSCQLCSCKQWIKNREQDRLKQDLRLFTAVFHNVFIPKRICW